MRCRRSTSESESAKQGPREIEGIMAQTNKSTEIYVDTFCTGLLSTVMYAPIARFLWQHYCGLHWYLQVAVQIIISKVGVQTSLNTAFFLEKGWGGALAVQRRNCSSL